MLECVHALKVLQCVQYFRKISEDFQLNFIILSNSRCLQCNDAMWKLHFFDLLQKVLCV